MSRVVLGVCDMNFNREIQRLVGEMVGTLA